MVHAIPPPPDRLFRSAVLGAADEERLPAGSYPGRHPGQQRILQSPVIAFAERRSCSDGKRSLMKAKSQAPAGGAPSKSVRKCLENLARGGSLPPCPVCVTHRQANDAWWKVIFSPGGRPRRRGPVLRPSRLGETPDVRSRHIRNVRILFCPDCPAGFLPWL